MTTPVEQKPDREDLSADQILCEFCTGKCCRYFALPIDEPEEWKDYEYIRWYMIHGETTIFCEDDDWYLMVHNKCDHLDHDNRCNIYASRPKICQDYTTNECEYEDDWTYDRYWETAEQIQDYMDAVLPKKRGESLRSPKPPIMPIIG